MATRGARGGARNRGRGSGDRNTAQSQSNIECQPSSSSSSSVRGARGGGRVSGDKNTSQSQSNVESQPSSSVRGPNVLEQVPNNPSKRKFIEVESDKEFTDHLEVIRDITCILKAMFGVPWATWRMVDKHSREALWQRFRNNDGEKKYFCFYTNSNGYFDLTTEKNLEISEGHENFRGIEAIDLFLKFEQISI